MKCPKCKSIEQDEINFDNLDGYGSTILEYDVVCANCGEYLNHYAYGYMEIPETKTEYIKWLWRGCPNNIKYYYKNIMETIKVLIN